MVDKKRKVILVDDHTLFRNGLRILLDASGEYEVIAEASNGQEFLVSLAKCNPDVVLLDIDMPVMDGITAAKKAIELYPDLKIITLSMYGEEYYYYGMVDAGVNGFLLKNSDITEVIQAIDTVCSGANYFSSELLDNLVMNFRTKPEHHSKEPHLLSSREIEILILICKGFSNQEIGDELYISKRTVDKHRANILEKSQCKNTAQLVVYAIKNKLVEV
ncbi:MAG: response regulator transcription factor [Mangrovibacterium sp.]